MGLTKQHHWNQSLLGFVIAALASSCVANVEVKSKLLTEGTPAPANDSVQPLTVVNNVAPVPEVGVSKVAPGTQHTCVIQAGKLSCWGLNKQGQIGNGESGVTSGVPDSLTGASYMVNVALNPYVVFPADVSDIAVGYEHSCAIKNEELFCWGSHEFGQLGIAVPANTVAPVDPIHAQPVSIISSGVRQVVARARWTCVVANQQMLCFGTRLARENGQLLPKLISRTPRVMIAANVNSISMSSNHACAVLSTGALQCFGMNAMGEVGNGDSSGADVPVPYEVFPDGVSAVAASDGRTCVVRSGSPFCFGASLGDRAVDQTAGGWKVPSPVPYLSAFWSTLSGIRSVSASGTAISSSGDLYYGSYFHSNGSPQKVALGIRHVDFSEADLGGCMMFQNHAVKCWGPNLFGQIGLGRRSAEEFSIFQSKDARTQ